MEPATQPGADLSDRDRLRAAISNSLNKEEVGLAAPPAPAPEADSQEMPEAETEVEATPSADTEAVETEDVETETGDTQDVPDEETEPLDLSDISSLFGTDPDKFVVTDDGQLAVKTKIDGKEGMAKLADLIKSYQLEGHLNKQNMEVQELRKSLESEKAQIEQAAQQKFQTLEDSIRLTLGHLTQEFNSIDWKGLETQNPAQYAVLRQKFADRHQQIQSAMAQIQQERQIQSQQQREQLLKRKEAELQALSSRIPEWATEEGFAKGQKEVKTGLKDNYGYSDEEINAVLYEGASLSSIDHRLYLIVRDALAYRKAQNAKPDIINKVRKAPKVVKGTQSSEKPKPKTKAEEVVTKIRKTGGGKGDIASYLKSLRTK